MADKKTESTMEEFTTNDQEDYYSGITCIVVNGKNAYELKGKFLDDLHNNAFDGTSGEDAVKHIEYFLRIVDLIDLPNVNHDKLRVVVFPISLFVNNKTMDIFTKGSLWDYWKMRSDEIEPTDEESFDLEETDHHDEQEIDEDFSGLNDYEWYEALEDSELKEDALRNKAIMDGLINDDNDDESHYERRNDGKYIWILTMIMNI
ncbi:hypothetical protein Tco_1228717 [Tanacetum coccineum]